MTTDRDPRISALEERIEELEDALRKIIKHTTPSEEHIPPQIRIDRVYRDAREALRS